MASFKSRLGQRLGLSVGQGAARQRRALRFEALEDRALMSIDFASAIGIGASSFDLGKIVVDNTGNTYVTGAYQGSIKNDPSGNALLSTGTTNTAFIAKYSPSSDLLWVKDFHPDAGVAGSSSRAFGIAISPTTGNIYLAGSFNGTIDLPAGSSQTPIASGAVTNAFIAELTPDGNLIPGSNSVTTFGGQTGSARFTSVQITSDGSSVYLAGFFAGTVAFDATHSLTSPASGNDTFLLKLNSDRSFSHVGDLQLLVANTAEPVLAIDGTSGSVYVVGTISSPLASDAFIARFDANATLTAVRTFGGLTSGGNNPAAQGAGVVTDGAGNVYVAGTFFGTGLDFGVPFGSPGQKLSSEGDADAYLIKVDPSFNLVWARRFGSTGKDSGQDLAIDDNANLYLTGAVAGQSSYGTDGSTDPVVLNDSNDGSGNIADAYVLEVNSAGEAIDVKSAGGAGNSVGAKIALIGSGKVVIDGTYTTNASFGNATLGSLGNSLLYLATLGPAKSGGTGGGDTGGNGSGGTGGDGSGGNGSGGNGSGGTSPTGPTATPPPTFRNEVRIFTGKGKKKKLTGFQLNFSSALDPATARNTGHYVVTQPGRTKKAPPKTIPVLAATLSASGTSVTLTLAKYVATKPLTLKASGLLSPGGITPTSFVSGL